MRKKDKTIVLFSYVLTGWSNCMVLSQEIAIFGVALGSSQL